MSNQRQPSVLTSKSSLAVFVIYSRVSQDNINEISQTTIERVSQYIVEKNLCCPKYTKSRYLDFLENKIKIKDIEVPDLEKLVSTRHIATIRMPYLCD